MAIDMIENNELGALAPSRLGLRQFADDKYKNYTGDAEFYNLFGGRSKKKSTIREKVRAKYIDLKTDCANIGRSIDIVSNDIATLMKQKSNLQQREALDESNIILGELKSKEIQQDCKAIMSKEESEKQRADTLQTLTSLSDISVQKAQSELAGLKSDGGNAGGLDTKKLLLYGGLGVAALIGIALILRK